MIASVYTHYGPPEVLQLKEVPKPMPKNNEVLVKIHATSVNRTDTGFRAAEYFAVRIVGSLGADEVIDYTKEDFTKKGKMYDVVLDAVGKSTFFKCKKILKPGGIYFSTELGPGWQNEFLPLITPLLGGKRVKFPIPTDSKEDILLFKELIEAGKYKVVIDLTYPIEQIMEATRYVEKGQKTGNVVIMAQHITNSLNLSIPVTKPAIPVNQKPV